MEAGPDWPERRRRRKEEERSDREHTMSRRREIKQNLRGNCPERRCVRVERWTVAARHEPTRLEAELEDAAQVSLQKKMSRSALMMTDRRRVSSTGDDINAAECIVVAAN